MKNMAWMAVTVGAVIGLVGCGGGGGGGGSASAAGAGTTAPSTPAPTPAPTPTPVPNGQFVEVGKFTLINDGGQAPARAISFGQMFQPGAVRATDVVQITLDGSTVAAQMDAKALNSDGSVRHAVVAAEVPILASGQRVQGRILAAAGSPAAITGFVDTPNIDVVIDLRSTGGQTRRTTLNLPTVARNTANAVAGSWLRGAVGEEKRYKAQVDDHLEVLFDVFTPRTGPSRVDISFHNDWTGISENDVRTYDVDILRGGASAFRATGVRHYPFATWHRQIWSDGDPQLRVTPDLAALETSAAVPRYIANFRIDGSITSDVNSGASSYGGAPLNTAIVTQFMPNTGGRLDIGPLPTWAVVDLLTNTANSRRSLLANADAAGSIPWHLRERGSGLPLTLDAHPDLWLDDRGDADVTAEPFSAEREGWTIDDAHQPSLTYLPYLLTGSQYYRDELATQAAYVLLSYDPFFRGDAAGLLIGKDGEAWQQVRGVAWSLRTVANAAFILPAQDPLRSYFDTKLKSNLSKLVQLYVVERRLQSAGELEGWIPGDDRPEEATSPWMQGYLAVVLTWVNDMGYTDAGRVVNWMSPFLSGLFTSSAKGFDPDKGAAYKLMVYASNGAPLRTWSSSYNLSDLSTLSGQAVDETWNNYGLIHRAALAGAYSINASPTVAAAYRFTDQRVARITYALAAGDPTFAIAPSRAIP